jgi:hypothetical protein
MTNIFLILLIILFSLLHNSNFNLYEKFINYNEHKEIYRPNYIKKLEEDGFKLERAQDFLNRLVSYDNSKYKTIIYSDGKIPNEYMKKIYSHCYLSLRLVKHDGNANQVIETGLMGINTIHNGECPSAIEFNNYQDVLDIIEKNKVKIGTKDTLLASQVKEYCTFTPNFFNVNKYFPFLKGEINQIYVSSSIKFFENKIMEKKKNIKKYYNKNKPAIFFGVYNKKDLFKILKHKSYGLIIFAGSDTYTKSEDSKSNFYRDKRLKQLAKLNKNKFKFMAISKYIYDDLKSYNIPAIKDTFYFGSNESYPVLKGNCIYTYLPLKKSFNS